MQRFKVFLETWDTIGVDASGQTKSADVLKSAINKNTTAQKLSLKKNANVKPAAKAVGDSARGGTSSGETKTTTNALKTSE